MAGWKRGHHDTRDMLVGALHAPLPAHASTRPVYAPPVRDQGQLGSCVANAACAVAGFLFRLKTGRVDPLFSRLDLYATTREIEGTPLSEDSGCFVRDVFKAMERFGVCSEQTWPYVEERYSVAPSRAAAVEALLHRALVYFACRRLTDIKASVAAGFPVIGGFACYESLMSDTVAQSGEVPYPSVSESQIGGHCVYFDGYDDDRQVLTFQNSWGLGWGRSGCGTLPYRYVVDGLASDFWTLRRET
jgi:C1A family cysteine protease